MPNRIKSHRVEIPKKTIQCNFYVDEGLANKITDEAVRRGRKFNTVARELLEEHLGSREPELKSIDPSDLESWLRSIVEALQKLDSKNRRPVETIIHQCLTIQEKAKGGGGEKATSPGVTRHPGNPEREIKRRRLNSD